MPRIEILIHMNIQENNITDVKCTVKNNERNGSTRNAFRLTGPKFAVRIPVSIPS
jgi:hypothetical protein